MNIINVFGVTLYGVILARQLKEKYDVRLMDNDPTKQGREYFGIKCLAPSYNSGKYILVVRSEYNQNIIKAELLELGVDVSQIEIPTNSYKDKILNSIDDRFYLECLGVIKLGYCMDLDNPIRFNEKLNWLKLNDRKPYHSTMVDKLAVKKYVADKIGDRYIAKLIGVWEKFEDINFADLPERFVLKCTHDSGGVIVCKDKNALDIDRARELINKNMSINFYYHSREWPYKNIQPKIIAEEYLDSGRDEVLIPYKFMCFNGEPRIVQVIMNDKCPNESINYYDIQWNQLKFRQNYPNCGNQLDKPKSLDEMLRLAKVLAGDEMFVRVDFFESNGQPYFSEYTFYSDAGFEPFYPDQWDYTLGNNININCLN